MTPTRLNLSQLWRRLSWPDVAAIVFVVVGLAAAISGHFGGLFSFAKFVGLLSAGYLSFRAMSWWRNRLLWSLRNRLIVAYLFIAVVPVLLLLTLAILAGQIFYSQLGGYLLYEEIHSRLGNMADSGDRAAAGGRRRFGECRSAGQCALPVSEPDFHASSHAAIANLLV